MDYNIFDLGFSRQLLKTSYLTPLIQNDMEVSSYLKSDFFNATNPTNISSGNTVGNLIVTDGYLKSSNYLAGVSGWQLTPTSADLNISLSVDEIHIPDEVTANSFHTDTDGNSWWGAIAIGDATASILNTGEGAFSNITITGGSVAASILDGTIGLGNLDLANRGWVQTCAFSVTDADTVAWAAGTFTSADGTAYSINAGNTGNMAAKTYIYLDVNVSETAYQTTTTATTAVGAGKVLVAIAENGTGEATYQVINGQGGVNIDASSIVAGSITGNEIAASTITAGKITVTSLSAISTNMGTVTVDSSGYIRGGATGYLTGTGFFLGYDTDAYKFHVGNPSGNNMRWTGTELIINDSTLNFESVFGDGSDGDVTISSDTSLSTDMYYNNLTINSGKALTCNGYRIFVKGTLTNNGTIKQNGGNGATATTYQGANGGAGTNSGSISGSPAGQAGSNGWSTPGSGNGTAGTAGTNITKGVGVNGVQGGQGGGWAGGGYYGGAVGAAGTISGTIYNKIKNFTSAYNLFDIVPSLAQFTVSAGSSGGTGGGGTNCGGGGGAGGAGGFCWIAAKTIYNNSGAYIQANGGNGGNGAAATGNGGGGGGGAGGSGGVVILIYSKLENDGAIEANGGAKGTGGAGAGGVWTDGADGNDGNDGVIIYIKQ